MKVLFIRSGNRGIDPISQNQGESLVKEGVNVIYYDIIGNGILGYFKNIGLLRSFIKYEKPNILHAHYSLTAYIAALAKQRIPLVVSLMGSDVNTSSKLNKLLISLFSIFFWNKIIVKSTEMKDNLGNKQALIIPNGVDFENYKLIDKDEALYKLKWDQKKEHILFASNPERPEKNYPLARKALDLLDSDNIEIHFLANISQTEMPYYYNAADLLLVTSKYEGSPNVIKEAMACNCPIVSTDVGDVKEIISGTSGCYLTTDDEQDTSSKIDLALHFNSRTNGRDKIAWLDSKLIANKLIAIYKGLE